mmetsp:Transcript_30463/g.54572  ORF Transcript_30463/g.54572 Transcript_30463/m.54572 type:complete len:221 (+) Transcript_30463:559-1221(+)
MLYLQCTVPSWVIIKKICSLQVLKVRMEPAGQCALLMVHRTGALSAITLLSRCVFGKARELTLFIRLPHTTVPTGALAQYILGTAFSYLPACSLLVIFNPLACILSHVSCPCLLPLPEQLRHKRRYFHFGRCLRTPRSLPKIFPCFCPIFPIPDAPTELAHPFLSVLLIFSHAWESDKDLCGLFLYNPCLEPNIRATLHLHHGAGVHLNEVGIFLLGLLP